MAVIDTTRAGDAPTFVFGGLSKLVEAYSAWKSARVTRKALSQLTDRELDDIGLSRADIETIAG